MSIQIVALKIVYDFFKTCKKQNHKFHGIFVVERIDEEF